MNYTKNSKVNVFLNQVSRAKKIAIIKSNPLVPQCWNKLQCEISIRDELGGYLCLTVVIL